MQPYQEAEQEIRRQAQAPKKSLGAAATVAGTLAGGSALASRILPLLNAYVPGEIMRKGIAKVSPRIGKFIDGAINNGYGLDEVRDFIKEKFEPEEEKEETQEHPILQEARIFSDNFPDLAQAVANLMKSGRTPQEAADIISKSLGPRVKEAEKKIGKKFIDFINDIFGAQQQGMQPQQQSQPLSQGQENGPQSAQGQVDPQLMQIVQGIRSSLEGLKNK